MVVFLPHESIYDSTSELKRNQKALLSQIKRCYKILQILQDESHVMYSRPSVKMWKNYQYFLKAYLASAYYDYGISLGYSSNKMAQNDADIPGMKTEIKYLRRERVRAYYARYPDYSETPCFIGCREYHNAHRKLLMGLYPDTFGGRWSLSIKRIYIYPGGE